MTKDEMEEVATRAVKRAFREMGIHGDAPDMQRDMAYLRDARKRHDSLMNRIFSWGATGFMFGGVALAWKDAFGYIFKSGGGQ